MKSSLVDWIKIFLLTLPEIGILVVGLGIIWYFDIQISAWVMGIGVILLLLVGYFSYKLIIPCFHMKNTTGNESMIGRQCEVVEALCPTGLVRFEGELWNARSCQEEIPAGVTVAIRKVDRLLLEVDIGTDRA